MGMDLSRFKVVYGDKVYNALTLVNVEFRTEQDMEAVRKKPVFIEILVINSDGNIEAIRDEAWRFQFIPIVNG